MTAQPELLPCPFCGAESFLIEGHVDDATIWPHGRFFRVYCGSCQVRQLYHRTALAAAVTWNTRRLPGDMVRDARRYRGLVACAVREGAVADEQEAGEETDAWLARGGMS